MINPSTMRLGIASILIGLVGAWGVRTMMDEEEPVAEKAPPQAALVPVAAADLPEGRVIRRGDVIFSELTQKEMLERGWQIDRVMLNVEDVIGRQLRRRMPLHSPFLTTDLYLEDDGPSYRLRDGYRAAQVTVPSSFSGHVEPGSTVDVFFTSEEKEAKGDMPAIPVKMIRVVQAATVLHVFRPESTQLQRAVGSSADPIVTLEVEPYIATNIGVLTGHGRFSMNERPAGDVPLAADSSGRYTESDEPPGLLELLGIEEPQEQTGPAIWTTEYVRGGSKGVQQFPVYYAPRPQDPEQLAQGGNPPANGQPANGQPANNPQGAARGPQPTPAGPPPAGAQPQVPYRPDTQTDEALPRAPEPAPTPAPTPAAIDTPPKAADPFVDDSEEVLPR